MQIEIRGAEKLSFRERQAVVLKETGHANEDIARRMGVGLTTVATLLRRAKAKGYQVVIVLPGDALGVFGEDEEILDEDETES